MDRKTIVKSWHEFAYNDLLAAKFLLGLHPLQLEIISYHCQQSAEKILKAFLIGEDIGPPRTHDLRLLWRMCREISGDFDGIEKECVRLSAYGVQARYPMEIEITENDMKQALDDADNIIIFISERLHL